MCTVRAVTVFNEAMRSRQRTGRYAILAGRSPRRRMCGLSFGHPSASRRLAVFYRRLICAFNVHCAWYSMLTLLQFQEIHSDVHYTWINLTKMTNTLRIKRGVNRVMTQIEHVCIHQSSFAEVSMARNCCQLCPWQRHTDNEPIPQYSDTLEAWPGLIPATSHLDLAPFTTKRDFFWSQNAQQSIMAVLCGLDSFEVTTGF